MRTWGMHSKIRSILFLKKKELDVLRKMPNVIYDEQTIGKAINETTDVQNGSRSLVNSNTGNEVTVVTPESHQG